ncbi:MAG: glycosyltransferase family 2 protein [Gemmatimonadaceae bacterium]
MGMSALVGDEPVRRLVPIGRKTPTEGLKVPRSRFGPPLDAEHGPVFECIFQEAGFARSLHDRLLTQSQAGSFIEERPANATPLAVSVIIPTFGRNESLVRCLTALSAQTLPREAFEVIVCDDGSPTPAAATVEPFTECMNVLVVRRSRAGPAAARNEGARHARSGFLAFTDDDCVPESHWLEALVERKRRHPGHMIGGSIVNLLPKDPYATATQLITSCVYDYYSRSTDGHRFFSTTNLAVPTNRFWLLDGFSERFPRAAGEDYDFCARWEEAGFGSEYAPEVEAGHAHGHSLVSFWKQHFGYGRALFRVREGMARRRGKSGIQLEAPGFYKQILTYPLKHSAHGRALRSTALVLLAQIATVVGGLREWLLPGSSLTAPTRTGEHRSPHASSVTL